VEDRAKRIVVGYDGGPDADLAIAWAIETARLESVPLVVVIAASAMDPVLVSDFHRRTERLAAQWQARAEKILTDAGVTDAAVEVRRGNTLPMLLTAVAPVDLLVVGSAGHAPFVETVGGSVSQHLARHAHCPVVVVRPAHRLDARTIVVGVDGSEESLAAVRFACARARLTGHEVLTVHGYREFPFPGTDHHERVARRLATWLAPVRADDPDVILTEEAVRESAPRLLTDLADEAALLVLGSRGRDAFADLLLGSTSQHALAHARCPVAIVR
jgi:nucleotide-binding universal stress UspA family protein